MRSFPSFQDELPWWSFESSPPFFLNVLSLSLCLTIQKEIMSKKERGIEYLFSSDSFICAHLLFIEYSFSTEICFRFFFCTHLVLSPVCYFFLPFSYSHSFFSLFSISSTFAIHSFKKDWEKDHFRYSWLVRQAGKGKQMRGFVQVSHDSTHDDFSLSLSLSFFLQESVSRRAGFRKTG